MMQGGETAGVLTFGSQFCLASTWSFSCFSFILNVLFGFGVGCLLQFKQNLFSSLVAM